MPSGGEKVEKTEEKGKEEKKEKEKAEEELSEEDAKLKADLEMLVERLEEPKSELYKPSLESLRKEIRTATTSVTSVPKPLKFLRPHFDRLKAIQEKMKSGADAKLAASVLSALAMTVKGKERLVLKYRLLGEEEEIGSWGQEYVKHLSSELGQEWSEEEAKMEPAAKARLLALAKQIVQFYLQHNSEVEAVDLLMEMGQTELLLELADETGLERIGLYLTSNFPYVPEPENAQLLSTAKALYLRFGREIQALLCAAMLNDLEEMKRIFLASKDPMVQQQMAVILARQQIFLDIPDEVPAKDDLTNLNSNSNLFQYFTLLARELDIMEPKHPDDIYKSHLEPTRGHAPSNVDSAKANLASSFVNGFVNTGFGKEKLMDEEPNKWFFKNKEMGMVSAAASVGLIHRWDIDSGLSKVDSSLYSSDNYIKAGTMMSIGIISSGIHHDCDPAQALLNDYVLGDHPEIIRIGAIFGLALAYTNSSRESVLDEIQPKLLQVLKEPAPATSTETQTTAALALGLIRVGSGDADLSAALGDFLCSRPPATLAAEHNFRLAALGLGLVWLGRQKDAGESVEKLRQLPAPFGPMAATLVNVCAYAATGNVLEIQKLLHLCSEAHGKEEEAKKEAAASAKDPKAKAKEAKESEKLAGVEAVAAFGVGVIAMGEEVGAQMSTRVMGMMMRYGEAGMRKAVPLALALTSLSKPELAVVETLAKFSHDQDVEVAAAGILGLGLVGAGTNNARLGNLLRQLAAFHAREPSCLFMVRIAQGLCHLGKGTCTINPFHMERQLLCPAALAGILTLCTAFLDAKKTILGSKQHWLLYSLVPAIQPRHLLTFVQSSTPETAQLEQVNVPVRVGQAVDVVGQAGKRKGITGFQTQTTPVLIAHGERAELATQEYIPISPYLEGIVLLKPNPDYEPSESDKAKPKTPVKAK